MSCQVHLLVGNHEEYPETLLVCLQVPVADGSAFATVSLWQLQPQGCYSEGTDLRKATRQGRLLDLHE